jgi:hypothetical protein
LERVGVAAGSTAAAVREEVRLVMPAALAVRADFTLAVVLLFLFLFALVEERDEAIFYKAAFMMMRADNVKFSKGKERKDYLFEDRQQCGVVACERMTPRT